MGYSGRHCARVLSVAGFLVIISQTLAGRRFILRGERPLFIPGRPSLFDNPGITVNSTPRRVVMRVYQQWCVPGVYREATYLPGCTGGHIQGGVPTRVYPGWYYRVEDTPPAQRPLSHLRRGITSAQRPLGLGRRGKSVKRRLRALGKEEDSAHYSSLPPSP